MADEVGGEVVERPPADDGFQARIVPDAKLAFDRGLREYFAGTIEWDALPVPKDEALPASGQPPDPCVMVIFGASGDLTKRKLIPALCNLAETNLLPRQFGLVGFSSSRASSIFSALRTCPRCW